MSSNFSPLSLFEAMFTGVSVPAMLVAENSKVVAINEGGAALFVMPVDEVVGQRWAALDANATLKSWRRHWKRMQSQELICYATDIETGRSYMRPIYAEARAISEKYALITLADNLQRSIAGDELDFVAAELQIGRWSYNRVDGHLTINKTCRKLLDLPETGIHRSELADLLRSRMVEADFTRLFSAAQRLFDEPCQITQEFVIQTGERTNLYSFTCRSVGNELHVTHLYGIVHQRYRSGTGGDPGSDRFLELAAFSLEQAQDMIIWSRPDGSVRYANHTALRALGYTAAELYGLRVEELLPNYSESLQRDFWATLRANKTLTQDGALIAKSGRIVPVTSYINYIRFGEEEFACGINRDVTEQRRTQERQRLMELTVDNAEDMIVWVHPNGSIFSANDTYLETTGLSREALAGMTTADVFVSEDRLPNLAEQLREPDDEAAWRSAIKRSGKAALQVTVQANLLQYEDKHLYCLYIDDVSTEKEKERQLSLARAALDAAVDCILWLGPNGKIEYANQALRRLVPDRMAKHLIGLTVDAVFPEVDIQRIEPGKSQLFDYERAGGKLSHMRMLGYSLKHDERRYTVLSVHDISDIQQERQQLEEAFTEIEVMRDRLRDENLSLREDHDSKYNVNNIITVSKKYQKILTRVGQVADVNTTVLITGETGTGKELLARAVHQLSAREDYPLVKVNCATLPENLIESELFGHEKGAFTGATSRRKGRFEMADRGTIFLDEIGELPLDLQSKLLRVLQEDEFERLGGETTVKVDVRLIAATNRDLEAMVRKGTFREDLYYRLSVFPIHNLPLRDRPEDIPVLIEYFTKKYAKRQGKRINKINTADIKRLSNYPFPGNIRELENIIERSVVLCTTDTLQIDFFTNRGAATATTEKFLTFEEMQRNHIIAALKRTGGRVTGPTGAGVLLSMNDRTLVSKIRKLGIQKQEYLL